MPKELEQWRGDFGKEYTLRNMKVRPLSFNANEVKIEAFEQDYLRIYGTTKLDLNRAFLGDIDRSIRILEVGTNVGLQLILLKQLGFSKLYGVEPQIQAVQILEKYDKDIKPVVATAFHLPFKDAYFDLVFTSGVLIHINPADIPLAMREIYRCSRKWIWGFEYYSPEILEVEYRSRKGLLWKADFANLYLQNCANLKLIKKQRLRHIQEPQLEDEMFLLEKISH